MVIKYSLFTALYLTALNLHNFYVANNRALIGKALPHNQYHLCMRL